MKKAGQVVNATITPHDLRRYSATYASRAGAPIEIVSKTIFRRAYLAMTQRYLGTISDVEPIKWVENVHG